MASDSTHKSTLVYELCVSLLRAADAEVISIDAVVREPNGVIVGVTLVKVCCTSVE